MPSSARRWAVWLWLMGTTSWGSALHGWSWSPAARELYATTHSAIGGVLHDWFSAIFLRFRPRSPQGKLVFAASRAYVCGLRRVRRRLAPGGVGVLGKRPWVA